MICDRPRGTSRRSALAMRCRTTRRHCATHPMQAGDMLRVTVPAIGEIHAPRETD
jgi:hypothetical protein